jgi:hypothetical protein
MNPEGMTRELARHDTEHVREVERLPAAWCDDRLIGVCACGHGIKPRDLSHRYYQLLREGYDARKAAEL